MAFVITKGSSPFLTVKWRCPVCRSLIGLHDADLADARIEEGYRAKEEIVVTKISGVTCPACGNAHVTLERVN